MVLDMASYATNRKLRIITERCGYEWRDTYPDRSIDSVYNELVGDDRKTLFCKLSCDSKDKIDQMLSGYNVEVAALLEQWIDEKYKDFSKREQSSIVGLAKDYS